MHSRVKGHAAGTQSVELLGQVSFVLAQPKVLELSEHKFGCRVIQKMLEVFPSHHKASIAAELRDKVVQCIYDSHGH